MHPLVQLAKNTVELYIRDKTIFEVREEDLPAGLQERAGVFVCLKIRGVLRGCIGTFEPTEKNVALETVRSSISAATCDPRFQCIRPDELESIEYTVDVLTPPVQVHDRSELDPSRYGVIVQAGGRRGLLLPDIEGVDTVDMQVGIAMQKAGIASGTTVTLFKFEVKRYN